jgi:DNA recombination protein RmuC
MAIMLIAVAAVLALATAVLAFLLVAAQRGSAEARAGAAAAASRLDAAVESRIGAERALAAAQQRVGDLEKVLAGADAARHEVVNAAKAAALETAQALSSKLIDDHKRETAEAKKDSEERVRQASATLVKQVDEIAKAVLQLNSQVEAKGRVLDTVWRSLTSPGGSGQIAEIGLANTLKGFGLENGRDYQLQATTSDELTGRRLRPDAIVFLPGNNALVIDCKASKYLLEIAEAESAANEEEAYANLARTMNQHLKTLADKDYRGAVLAEWRAAGRSVDMGNVLSIMYLPSEAALEKLARADAAFFARARAAEIIPAGPAGLHCALSLAAAEITKERRAENQQRIIEGAQALLEAVAIALRFVTSVGKGIRSAAESYDHLTRSVNQRLLPRAHRLAKLGVPPGKALPASLPAFTVMSQERDQLIEGEAAELPDEEPPRLLAE